MQVISLRRARASRTPIVETPSGAVPLIASSKASAAGPVLDPDAQPVRHLVAIAKHEQHLKEPVAMFPDGERLVLGGHRIRSCGESSLVDHGFS